MSFDGADDVGRVTLECEAPEEESPLEALEQRAQWLDRRVEQGLRSGRLGHRQAAFIRGELEALKARFSDVDESGVSMLSVMLDEFFGRIRKAEASSALTLRLA